MPAITFGLLVALGSAGWFIVKGILLLIVIVTMPFWGTSRWCPETKAASLSILNTELESLKGVPVCYHTGMPGNDKTPVMLVVGVDEEEMKLITDTGRRYSRSQLVMTQYNPLYSHLYQGWLRKQQESRQEKG